jgi:hypothetical protein
VVKIFFFLCLALFVAKAEENTMKLTLHHGDIVATKIIVSTFAAMGFKVHVYDYSYDGETTHMMLKLFGRKPFEAGEFRDLLRENNIEITTGAYRQKVWQIEADAASALWNIPIISPDEGGQLSKSSDSQWFALNGVTGLSIEAPYGGKWYPQVALLDERMEVLTSYEEHVPKENLRFALPQGARYLKVSNASGMKLLREGTWIEQAQE